VAATVGRPVQSIALLLPRSGLLGVPTTEGLARCPIVISVVKISPLWFGPPFCMCHGRCSGRMFSRSDDQLEFGRLFDRDVGWLCPAQNLVDQLGGSPEYVREVGWRLGWLGQRMERRLEWRLRYGLGQ
jgi:hypothetical protein